MYLKRLEMLGFKSFATRTLLEFSPGITAIVGPNGAGKSNVADSIRWVLGEQSMRQLRGKKSDDIIFIGSQGKAALGMAEVSLTLDNSTGWVPSDYSEITVTRRSYRSGENEYLINKQKVRLKDVLLLLAQARIGHDSYTVVGQGLIDAALSLRAEERRGLFEDAAGIRPFQVQRMDAETRLKQTEQNLERLRDIVREIEPRLAPLAEQARRAVEFRQLSTELDNVLLGWYTLQWRRVHAARMRTEQSEQAAAQRARLGDQALQEVSEQAQVLRTERQQAQTRLQQARNNVNEAREQAQKFERELAVIEERVGGFERQQSDLRQEEQHLRERMIALQRQSSDLEEQCDLADEALDNGAAHLATLESGVAQAQKAYEAEARRLRNVQNDLVQVQARLGSTQSEMGRLQKQVGEKNQTLAARRNTLTQAQQTSRTLEARIEEERVHLASERDEEQRVSQQKQTLTRAISDGQQEIERIKATLAEVERQKRSLMDRLNLLKNWQQSLSGYSDGVRALLRASPGTLSGLLGPVPQLCIVPPGFETALEAALGSAMQAVAVRTFEDARRSLDYLTTTMASKAMVVWLERDGEDEGVSEIQHLQEQQEEMVLRRFLEASSLTQEHVAGFAWQLLRYEPRFSPLFRRLLHGIVVARDITIAFRLLDWASQLSLSSDADLPLSSIVTLKGEQLHVGGWLSSGGKSDAQQGLLAHERELRELPTQLDRVNATIQQVHETMSEAQRRQEGCKIELAGLDKELQKIVNRINDVNRVINLARRDSERVQTEIRMASSIEQQLVAEITGLEQEIQAAQERVRAHEKAQREMRGQLEEFQGEMEEQAATYRRQQDELARERTALAVKRQEAQSLRRQLTAQQTQAQDLKTQVNRQVARREEGERQQALLQREREQYRSDLATAQASTATAQSTLTTIEQQLAQVEQQNALLEQRRAKLGQEVREQETAYRRVLLESQKARDAAETLLTQLYEETGIDDAQQLIERSTRTIDEAGDEKERQGTKQVSQVSLEDDLSEEEETQLKRYRKRIETLRGQLKTMGGYDVDAPQLYEETKTRYEFLSSQISDMDGAASQLHEIIDQLDATMARQFETTFQSVNARFREHFTTLFNGGTARLELVIAKSESSNDDGGVPTAMPSGVDVIVQPPGKKVQDLSLLSGGERALVSAALLFSLLEINPPPFCLLDEVDAALDESNVVRFCEILKSLARNTQFIVITHNRVSMTAAQVVYGVSMRESVSRLLSLQLEATTPVAL